MRGRSFPPPATMLRSVVADGCETSEALEGLSHRIDGLGLDLRSEMATQGAELRAELRAEMVAMREELGAEIRHVRIQVESLRHDIRIVAEGAATLAVKLDRL
jgi:Zn-dependent M32 family carboxypeptidase